MEMLRFYSIKLKKLNKTSTIPFNISGHKREMIIFNRLSDRFKSRLRFHYFKPSSNFN